MNKSDSQYKTIGQVAKILNLKNKKTGTLSTHTIRFWEKEFKQVRPKILNANRRYYDQNLINLLIKIKYLLKEKGMTLNGVKKALNSEDYDIDEFNNTTINQKKILKIKIKRIKSIIETLKHKDG